MAVVELCWVPRGSPVSDPITLSLDPADQACVCEQVQGSNTLLLRERGALQSTHNAVSYLALSLLVDFWCRGVQYWTMGPIDLLKPACGLSRAQRSTTV